MTMSIFSIDQIAITIMGYPISWIELLATIFGLISVYLATKANILTWPSGILNEFFLFLLFFQVQLYADMLLQVYFFVVTLYGWYYWNADTEERKISRITNRSRAFVISLLVLGSLGFGIFFSKIHLLLPQFFTLAADYPYTDSFVLTASIIATFLLARKKVESWYLWILVDIVSVVLFYIKNIQFLALEYLIFLGLASFGLWNWEKQLRDENG